MSHEVTSPAPTVPASVSRVLVLGAGFTGAEVAEQARARGLTVLAHTRSEERAAALRARGFAVWVAPELGAELGAHVDAGTHVVVAFPPDGVTDQRIAPLLAGAHSIAYVSSTGVYGGLTGPIDDTTPLPEPLPARAQRLVEAERAYRAVGAVVLRCPGIYGPSRGLEQRVLRGEHRIPGEGKNVLSRIHVADLAALLLAASALHDDTFVVGDLTPAPHVDVVRHIAERHGVPMPPSVPADTLHESLRADRAIDPRRALGRLGVTLRYPSYREGMPGPVTERRPG
jgi:nucleoside-diphosphate-sugar epimerase